MAKGKKKRTRADEQIDLSMVEPPKKVKSHKNWKGIIITDASGSRVTVADPKSPMTIAKIKALMDREFKDGAPHDVFWAKRDDSLA